MITFSVENASFSYSGGKTLLQNIGFSVSSGEILAILGPNGSGKTTLLRCMTGLLPWTSGRSCIDGVTVKGKTQRDFWRRVSYVPQARGAYSALTVEEMILLGGTGALGLFSAPGEDELHRAEALMERLHISHLSGSSCTEISGGELQMVLIARALFSEPELLILDEPESNLDFRNRMIVLDTLSALAKDGMCCIFNTHYPDHALTRADRALLLYHGGVRFGAAREIITEESIRDAFGVHAAICTYEENGVSYPAIIPMYPEIK